MKFYFRLSENNYFEGTTTLAEDEALKLFCSVQDKTVEAYFKDAISAAVQTAVNMINYAGGADKVKSVLDRQGGAQ